jgi:hypothetical protein
MRLPNPLLPGLFVLLLVAAPALLLTGCGSRPESAASSDELDAYLQANPDIASEDAPDVEAE